MQRIEFISTRIAGPDGVSLETHTWRGAVQKPSCECFCVAGELDDETGRAFKIAEAAFTHPAIGKIQEQCFGKHSRPRALSKAINDHLVEIKDKICRAQDKLKVDQWIAQNCLPIPMNIPPGLALTEFIAETGLPCIARHHDFWWQRERFTTNAANDYLNAAFAPRLSPIRHGVINSEAASQLSDRLRLSCTLIPNVMDFDSPPPEPGECACTFRRDIGVAEDAWLILQPTRVVARKGIEHAIELVKRLDDPRAVLVITHGTGDEGDQYARHVRNFAQMLGVPVKFVYDWMRPERPAGRRDGGRLHSIADAYASADLVTYPSGYEGFGNAFLEAIYYCRAILCNRYSIYQTDIEPKGFKAVTMDGFVSEQTVENARRVLQDESLRRAMTRHNYELGRQFFSYTVLKRKLQGLLAEIAGVQR
jgi:glycosyltransferase involved in cell wall biosynthesis